MEAGGSGAPRHPELVRNTAEDRKREGEGNREGATLSATYNHVGLCCPGGKDSVVARDHMSTQPSLRIW